MTITVLTTINHWDFEGEVSKLQIKLLLAFWKLISLTKP